MARINIEDDLFSDDRFLRLVELTNSRLHAVGAIILAMKMAQKYWIPNKKLIPAKEWMSLPCCDHLAASGLAEIIGEEVYVKGTEKYSEWWFKKQESGRKGGLAKASNAKHNYSVAKQNVPSSSSSSSSSYSYSKKGERGESPHPRFLVYGSLYKNKNNKEPTWSDSAQKQLKKLDHLSDTDFEIAVSNFFKDGREYYRKQGYQLHCLVKDIDQHLIDKTLIKDPLAEFFAPYLAEMEVRNGTNP